MGLKEILEQSEKADLSKLPKNLKFLINSKLPSYWGIILEDGMTVKLAYANHFGYTEEIPFETYILGMNQAYKKGKDINTTFFPKNLEKEIKQYLTTIFERELKDFFYSLDDPDLNETYFQDLEGDLGDLIDPSRDMKEYINNFFKSFSSYDCSSESLIKTKCEVVIKEFIKKRIQILGTLDKRFPTVKHVK